MNLKRKILFGYGFLMAIMTIAIAWSIWNLIVLSNASSEILKENYRSIIAAENMIDSIERQDSAVLIAIIGFPSEGKSQFSMHDMIFLKWLARAQDNITIKGEKEIVEAIYTDYSNFRDSYNSLFSQLTSQNELKLTETAPVYKESLLPVFLKVRSGCEQLRKLNEETMYSASQRTSFIAKKAIWSTGLVAFIIFTISIISGSILVERIVQPLRNFVNASRKIANGDYDVQIELPVAIASEIELLANEFNSMAKQLQHYHAMNFEKILEEKNKIEAVLASIEDGLVVLAKDLSVAGINLSARNILGVEFTDSLQKSYNQILPAKICKLIDEKNSLSQSAVGKGPANQATDDKDKNIVTIHKGEKTRHYLFSLTLIPSKKEINPGYVILFKDITALREIEKLKDEFIAAASHELKTPLTSIKMSLALLSENCSQKFSEKDKELLSIAEEEISRLKALVDDLLDLSKIEAGKIELDFAAVGIGPIVSHAVKVFNSQLGKKSASIQIKLPADLKHVRADSNKITWVLTNLISNALRYIPEQGSIIISAANSHNFVTVSVKDNGPGIPLEFQTKIFQKFVRVDEKESGGTGLGLAICKEIIRAHGGTIWLESTPGKGSCFNFTIPIM